MKNYYLKALTLLSCLLIGITAHAHDFEAQNSDGAKIYYDITSSTDKTVSVTYQGSSSTENVEYSGEITIPETVTYNGTIYSVTSIDSYAFSTCSGLTSVEIPNSIIHIGEEAFINCVGLSSITIPNSITSIGNYAFYNCIALRELQIEKGESTLSLGYNRYNSSGTGKGLFYDCPLETLYIGRNISYSSEKSYGYSPFYNKTTLKSITISNSVTSIGDYAFYYCSGLTNIECKAKNPPTLGENVFSNYSASLIIPLGSYNKYNETEVWNKFNIIDKFLIDNIYYSPSKESELTVVFKDTNYNSYSGDIVIPSEIVVYDVKYKVTQIGEKAFYNCTDLTSITIPNSVTSIGEYAFYGCSGLTNITIPNSVTSIGDYAFQGCTGLTSIIIPNSIKNIRKGSFSGCIGLTNITIPNSVTSIDNNAFCGCTSLKELQIEDGEATLSLGYNYYSKYSYGEGLFYDCPLETLYLGRNLSYYSSENFGFSPFYNKNTLKSVTIGNSVTSIGGYAFRGCSGLTSVTIPNSVTSIGYDAFYGCI